jgi:hypothetical protein
LAGAFNGNKLVEASNDSHMAGAFNGNTLVGLEFEDHQNKTDICILIMF